MNYQCRIELRSHINHGEIVLGDVVHELEEKEYHHSFTSAGDRDRIISIRGLSSGLERGIEILSVEIDGFVLPERFITLFVSFSMEGNPYVDNRVINEKEIMFNGGVVFTVDKEILMYFPWYHSKKEIDFVYLNKLATCTNSVGCWSGEGDIHPDEWPNVPYDPLIKCQKGDDFALGCSVTYGTAVEKSLTWPSLLELHNFGQPGMGVDSIYHIASQVVGKWSPGRMIILFPELSRRLIKFRRGDYHFRFPCTIRGPVNLGFDPLDQSLDAYSDYYHLKAKELYGMFQDVKKEMVLDNGNTYSRRYLKLISELPCEIQVSSWNKETYEILPNHFKNVLPFFNRTDRALDASHPGPLSHENWVEELKNHNI